MFSVPLGIFADEDPLGGPQMNHRGLQNRFRGYQEEQDQRRRQEREDAELARRLSLGLDFADIPNQGGFREQFDFLRLEINGGLLAQNVARRDAPRRHRTRNRVHHVDDDASPFPRAPGPAIPDGPAPPAPAALRIVRPETENGVIASFGGGSGAVRRNPAHIRAPERWEAREVRNPLEDYEDDHLTGLRGSQHIEYTISIPDRPLRRHSTLSRSHNESPHTRPSERVVPRRAYHDFATEYAQHIPVERLARLAESHGSNLRRGETIRGVGSQRRKSASPNLGHPDWIPNRGMRNGDLDEREEEYLSGNIGVRRIGSWLDLLDTNLSRDVAVGS